MRAALLLVLIALATLLGGCGRSLDSEQLRICREIIPAINPGVKAIKPKATKGGKKA